jgi:hypothetical protein
LGGPNHTPNEQDFANYKILSRCEKMPLLLIVFIPSFEPRVDKAVSDGALQQRENIGVASSTVCVLGS